MYSSVKFLEPTVSVTLPLSGFDWISPAWALVVDELLPTPPQAAMPTARIEAAYRTNSARNRDLMLIESLLRCLGHLPAPRARGNPMPLPARASAPALPRRRARVV